MITDTDRVNFLDRIIAVSPVANGGVFVSYTDLDFIKGCTSDSLKEAIDKVLTLESSRKDSKSSAKAEYYNKFLADLLADLEENPELIQYYLPQLTRLRGLLK